MLLKLSICFQRVKGEECESSWAFSTTGSLEGQYFNKTGTLTSFSAQQLVDCTKEYGNNGCEGGFMDNAFKYLMDYGAEKESDYPYTAQVSSNFDSCDCQGCIHMGSFKFQFSLGFVTSCYVIINIYIAINHRQAKIT